MKWCYLHIAFFLMLLPLTMKAQQFVVESFRTLPNDLTAFHTPVYDLNHDACALLKVVCSSDYVFDSPLGIVKRVDEVGEVLIYLPKGSILLTIRHPQWGILRDYKFPSELASNITYELIIGSPQIIAQANTPEEHQPVAMEPDTITTPVENPIPILKEPDVQPSAHISTNFLLTANIGISSETLSYGIRLAMLRKHGAWISVQSNFKSSLTTAGECDSTGKLTNGSGTPYYNGEIKRSLLKVMGGGIHRIIKGLHLYEGIGYGNYSVVWGASNGNYYKNTDDSANGLAAEIGALYRLGKFAFSVGGSTIMAKHWEVNAGIGFCF